MGLDNQGLIRINSLLSPHMLHATIPVRPKEIKPQAIYLGINFLDQLVAEKSPPRRIYGALKH